MHTNSIGGKIVGLILDAIFIFIVISCVYFSAKKGFVRSFIEVAGYVLAIIIALNLGALVGEFIFNNHIKPATVTAISSIISDSTSEAVDSVPAHINLLLENADIDLETLANAENVNVDKLTDTIKPLAVDTIKSLVAFVAFIALMFLVRFLAGVLNSFFSFSILGTLNKFLGGTLGIIKGFLIASAFCMVAYFVALITSNDFLIFTEKAIQDSTICKLFINIFLGKV